MFDAVKRRDRLVDHELGIGLTTQEGCGLGNREGSDWGHSGE